MVNNSSRVFPVMKQLAAVALIACSTPLFGQQTTVENIGTFQDVVEMDQAGFCAVYEEDGQKGKIRNYTLKFFDYEYAETNSALVELSKIATVSNSGNNATHLAIAFNDFKLKQTTVKSFDKQGNLEGSLKVSDDGVTNAKIYEAPEGFIIVNTITKGGLSMKLEFEIIGVDNSLSVLWKKVLNEETVREVVDVLASEEGVALVYTSGKGMGKEKYDQHLMRISAEGNVVFDKVFANNYFYFPNKILLDGDKTLIFGSFPENGKSKPAGIFAIAFNAGGDILFRKEIDYSKEISPQIKDIMTKEDDINMKETPQFIVNDVIKTEEGYIVVTETIQLRPAVGASVEVSTGGSGGSLQANTAFHMGDFLVLNLKNDLELSSIKIVNKPKNRVVFQGIIANVNMYYHVLKQNNVSNFQFWMPDGRNHPIMVYTIRESFRSNIQIGVVDLTDNDKVLKSKVVESDLEKMKDVSGFGVLKSIENKLCVYVYKKGVLLFYDLKYI